MINKFLKKANIYCPSLSCRSSEWLNKKLSPNRKRRPSDAHIATLTPIGRPTLVKPKQASSR